MLWHPVQQLTAQSHARLVIAMAGTGVTWVQCSPMLRLLCEYILALYLTPQRCTSALPKSHRWAAVHLLCVPAGMLFIASRDWDSPGPTCPGCCHSSVAPDDQLSCLCTGHLPAPAVTLKVREHAESHLQGFFICFFSY